MTFGHAIDLYIADMRAEGRINSDRTERAYRDCLNAHAEDVNNRDPRTTNRDDVKKTLRRWANPNSRSTRHACLVSFYDWCMEEAVRKDNPARQVRRAKRQPGRVYRPTRADTIAILEAAETLLERRAAFLGVCAGPRNYELRHLQRRHFERPGFVWISPDIAKGGRERWVPVIAELQPVVAEILATVGPTRWDERSQTWVGEYVLHGQVNASPGRNDVYLPVPGRPMGAVTLWRLIRRLGRRAGIHADIGPHVMRRAFADYIARSAGLYMAQALLGHADVSTTRGYTDAPTLDELRAAVEHLRIRAAGHPPERVAANPLVETVGIEPTDSAVHAAEPNPDGDESPLAGSVERLGRVLRAHREFFVEAQC